MARLSRYPLRVEIDGYPLELRPMDASDEDAMLRFAASIDPDDRMLLRSHIEDPAVVRDWITQIEAARRITLVAVSEGAIVAYGSLIRRYLSWMRHLGEIRILVAPPLRGRGLGGVITREVLALASGLGMSKLVAQVAREQAASKRVLMAHGFVTEALLADWIIDRRGRTHDLMILSHDLHAIDVAPGPSCGRPGESPATADRPQTSTRSAAGGPPCPNP